MTLRTVFSAVCGIAPRDRENYRRILYWLVAWMASWTGANLAMSAGLLSKGLPAALAAVMPLVFGAGTLVAFRRFLREADELRRKIELDALAIAFGAGVLGGFTLWLLARAGVAADIDGVWTMVLMMGTYSIAVTVGQVRYS